MSYLLTLLQSLLPLVQSQSDLDEDYLGQSSDMSDFERRLRVIDQRGR